jgi:hypothetical protein
MMGAASCFLPFTILAHCVVRLDGLFELANNYAARTHRTVRVMYFYSWGDSANLQNREVKIREKRGMAVY